MHRFDSKHHTGPFLLLNRNVDILGMLKCLIENGFDVNSRYDENSPTLLEAFVDNVIKRFDAIEFLIDYGADVNALHSKAKNPDGKHLTIFQHVNTGTRMPSKLVKIFKDSQ